MQDSNKICEFRTCATFLHDASLWMQLKQINPNFMQCNYIYFHQHNLRADTLYVNDLLRVSV
jgi:hypothetical protein